MNLSPNLGGWCLIKPQKLPHVGSPSRVEFPQNNSLNSLYSGIARRLLRSEISDSNNKKKEQQKNKKNNEKHKALARSFSNS